MWWTMDMNLSKLWEVVEDRGAWRAAAHGVGQSRTQLSEWTTAMRTSNVVDLGQAHSARKLKVILGF